MTQGLGRFLTDASERGRSRRSRAGNILLVLLFPALLGVMACFDLPVPVGDPEQSAVDPELSGIWLGRQDDERVLLILKPYDRRTWLVMWSGLEPVKTAAGTGDATVGTGGTTPAADDVDDEDAPPPDPLTLLRNGGLSISETLLFKGWLTPMQGTLLMTWEPLADPDSETGLGPHSWFITRVVKHTADEFQMHFINREFQDLDNVQTRVQAEDIIRRNLDDPDLFINGADIPGYLYTRILQSDYDQVQELLKGGGISSPSD